MCNQGRKKIFQENKAFTLVELIIVIAIMAVLAGLIVPNVIRYIRKARASRATEEARVIVQAIQHSVATGEGQELNFIIDKQYIDSSGNVHDCSILTNYSLSRAQNNAPVTEGSSDYPNYVLAQDILEELHSASGSDYKFYKFNGSQTNPIGANCEQFYSQYGCPGIIIAYDSSGHVYFMEYYNYECLIRYEDGAFTYCENEEKFSGSERLKY